MLGPIWVGQDWKGNSISEALVGPFVVVMQQVFLDGLGDAGGSQQQEPVQGDQKQAKQLSEARNCILIGSWGSWLALDAPIDGQAGCGHRQSDPGAL